jgi:NADPH:quinone reductase-like Zn-dependent oxidoreductase
MEHQMTRIALAKAGGPDQLSVEYGPVPGPGPGQVVVRMEAAGVAFNDITTRQGRNPGRLPPVIGFDVVGRVVAAGSGVTWPAPGDRVAALVGTGGYASHVLVAADRAVAVPDGLDAAVVDALVLNYLTAWQMLHRVARVESGQTVLVLGAAGGVGSALVDLAVLAGIRVIGTSSPPRRSAVEGHGAQWVRSIADVHDPVEAAFDAVGGPSLALTRRVTHRRGTVVSFGFSHTVDADHSKLGGLARTIAALVRARITPGARVRLYQVEGSVKKDPAGYREDLTRLIALVEQGWLRPAVTRIALTQAAAAHRRLENRQVAGKVVLVQDTTVDAQPDPESARSTS